MYIINYLCPREDNVMGGHGFSIELSPAFREAVALSGMTQEHVNHLIKENRGRWLKACGYNPDGLYRFDCSWGEWGPEHMSVPGNACGLDIDRCPVGRLADESVMLTPHNIDWWPQKQLLLIMFTELAYDVILFAKTGGLKEFLKPNGPTHAATPEKADMPTHGVKQPTDNECGAAGTAV